MECYSAMKKEETPAICGNMDRPVGITLSEVSQTEEDNYSMISLKCGI